MIDGNDVIWEREVLQLPGEETAVEELHNCDPETHTTLIVCLIPDATFVDL